MRKTISVAPTPAQLIATIRNTAAPLLEAYLTDLNHDETWITGNPGTGFVHITRALGTELRELPAADPLVEDKHVPYLFGSARPSRIYRQVSDLLKTHMNRVARHVLVFDGQRLYACGIDQAIEDYDQALVRARNQARRIRARRTARRVAGTSTDSVSS